MVTIAGRLEDPLGNAIPDCQIELITQKNGSVVLVRTSATSSPDGAGNYSMNVQPGFYAVRLIADGCPPNYIGDIKIYSDAKSGTLNDFLLSLDESEITPALLAQVIDERKQAQDAAQAAEKSVTDASSTLANVVKKTGDTMSGPLLIDTNNNSYFDLIESSNKAMRLFINNDNGGIGFSGSDSTFPKTRLRFIQENNTWNFENSSVKINNQVAMKQGDYGLFLSVQKVIEITSNKQLGTFVSGERQLVKDATGTYLPSKNPCYLVKLASRDNSYGGSFLLTEYFETGKTFIGKQLSASSTVKWQEFITTENSTVDSNGFYKKASPICRLFGDDNLTEVEGFNIAGCGLVNSEADGVVAKRIDVGHYEIHGSLGFAKEGWYITLPEDANGNKKIFAEYSTDDNHIITVKTFTRKFDTEQCEVIAGKPIDIIAERWIDIRLEMPVNEVVEETDL